MHINLEIGNSNGYYGWPRYLDPYKKGNEVLPKRIHIDAGNQYLPFKVSFIEQL
jgi:hypothetical protein